MTGVSFLILFGFSCVLFPCEGKTLCSHLFRNFILSYAFLYLTLRFLTRKISKQLMKGDWGGYE